MKTKDSSYYAYLEGWISVVLNILLFGLKYWAGVASGSIAIIADAWHTLSDSISSIIVLVGARAAAKPADKQHPFGHGRAELVAALFIGLLLALVSFNFLIEAYERFQVREQANFGWIAITVTVFAIVVKEGMAQFAFWTARKTGSASLKADGWHHRSDAISSVVILVGVFLGNYWWWIDSALTLVVALIIGHAAWEVFDETISSIMGEGMPDKDIEKLKSICNDITGMDCEAHNILLHNYVTRRDLSLHVYFPAHKTLLEVHEYIQAIEKQVGDHFNAKVIVHADPIREGK